jgi:hypothetical protein
VALGRLVLEVDAEAKKPKVVFVHPRAPLTGLAHSAEAGLFYSTARGVGLVGARRRIELVAAKRPMIRVRAAVLYVLLPDSLGVFKIPGVDQLERLGGDETPGA